MFKKILFISTLLFASSAYSADYLDTQFGDNGLEVHIMKVSINKNIMTIVFAAENTGEDDAEFSSFPVRQVYFSTSDRKYPVIKDTEGLWLASTIAYSNTDIDLFSHKLNASEYYTFTIKPNGKKVGWMKFEAPQDGDWPLDLTLPGITPFTLNKPE